MLYRVLKLGASPAGVRTPGDLVELDAAAAAPLLADGAVECAAEPASAPSAAPAPPHDPEEIEEAVEPEPSNLERAVEPSRRRRGARRRE